MNPNLTTQNGSTEVNFSQEENRQFERLKADWIGRGYSPEDAAANAMAAITARRKQTAAPLDLGAAVCLSEDSNGLLECQLERTTTIGDNCCQDEKLPKRQKPSVGWVKDRKDKEKPKT